MDASIHMGTDFDKLSQARAIISTHLIVIYVCKDTHLNTPHS